MWNKKEYRRKQSVEKTNKKNRDGGKATKKFEMARICCKILLSVARNGYSRFFGKKQTWMHKKYG
jgi:hypothetical protein